MVAMLDEICTREDAARGVMLASLVCTKATGMPGDGYFVVGEAAAARHVDRRAFWEGEVERVFEAFSGASRDDREAHALRLLRRDAGRPRSPRSAPSSRTRARRRRTITYGELTRELTAVRLHPHHPALPYLLDEVDRASDASDGVMLAAIVRHAAGDHMRGRRFFRTARELGREVGDDEHAFWAAEVERVFERYAGRP